MIRKTVTSRRSKSVFSTVAIGIFIEHLSIAASKFDYDVKIEKVHNN